MLKYINLSFIFILLLKCHSVFSQNQNSDVLIDFRFKEYLIEESQIISNLILVYNNGQEPLEFNLNVTYPGGWKLLTSTEKIHVVNASDSIFIPLRIIPLGKIKGNTKYYLNAYIINVQNQVPIKSASFAAFKKKISNWEVNSGPREKIYFLNNSNETSFDISILNTGNDLQEIAFDLENPRKDIIISDTTDKIIRKKNFDFELDALEDTVLYYRIKNLEKARNYKIIDIENYRANFVNEKKAFSLFVKTFDPKSAINAGLRKGKKVDFIKLSNEEKVTPYGSRVFPLIAEANINNILGVQPILNFNLRGNTQLENGATINYFSQLDYTTFRAQNQLLRGFHMLGYYDKKINLQVGNVSPLGGVLIGVGGAGISGTYRINSKHKIGAAYMRSPRFFGNSNTQGYGLSYEVRLIPRNVISLSFAQAFNSVSNFRRDLYRISTSYAINQNHSLGFNWIGSTSIFNLPGNSFNRFGYTFSGNYNSRFFNKKLSNNLGGTIMSGFFSPFFPMKGFTVNNNLRYKLNNSWSMLLTNSFRENEMVNNQVNSGVYLTRFFTNVLTASHTLNKGVISPSAFYNISNMNGFRIHSRGLGLNYSYFDYEKNMGASVFIRGGYNKPVDIEEIPNYFIFQTFLMIRYRTFTGNLRYNYGPFSMIDSTGLFLNDYPQSISSTVNHQYQFANSRFVMNNNANYSYFTNFQRHSIGYFPEIFYFTNTGWRFRFGLGYFWSSANTQFRPTFINNVNPEILPESKNQINQGVNINIGIRKEFGIPIPGKNKQNYTLEFISFIDLNGNSKKDPDEVALENVVVRVGNWEVISDEKGNSKIINIPAKEYIFNVFSLVDLKSFFPNITDTLMVDKTKTVYVPFVKGVKIFGNVFVDREKFSVGSDIPMDLSGIKITASNKNTYHTLTDKDGNYNIFLPHGEYTLSMDERILGDRFTLLQNNFEVKLDLNTESIFITFYITEKRRKVTIKKFNANGETKGE
jgi:hypothetical protein